MNVCINLHAFSGPPAAASRLHAATDLSGFLGLDALNERILMENAERLGREERRLIGQKLPVRPLPALSREAAGSRRLSDPAASLLSAAALKRDGCLGVRGVLGSSAADELLAFVNAEQVRAEQAVADGRVKYDERFGAVNNRSGRL